MAALILPSRRVVQPQGPVEVDWGNPLARGLVVAVDGNGAFLYRRQPLAALTKINTFSQRATAQGAFTSNGGTGYLSQSGATDLIGAGSAEFSVVGLFALNATGQANRYFASVFNAGGSAQSSVIYGFAANNIEFFAANFSGSNPRPGSGLIVSDTNPHVFVYSYRPGVWISALDGVVVNNQNATFGLSVGVVNQSLFAAESGGNISNASFGLWLSFSRALSPVEIAAISQNPWQLFRPIQRRIWVGGAAVTLPTLVQPASTISTGAWTATGAATLHQAINEPTPSASEFISTTSASTCVMELANAAFPGGANKAVRYWASSAQGSNLTVTLRQGATQIMTRTHPLASVNTLYTQTLTAPEIAQIVAGPVTVELTAS